MKLVRAAPSSARAVRGAGSGAKAAPPPPMLRTHPPATSATAAFGGSRARVQGARVAGTEMVRLAIDPLKGGFAGRAV